MGVQVPPSTQGSWVPVGHNPQYLCRSGVPERGPLDTFSEQICLPSNTSLSNASRNSS